MVIDAIREVGIDLLATGARPKSLTEAAVRQSDVVITMGGGDMCPFFPGAGYRDPKLDDPPARRWPTSARSATRSTDGSRHFSTRCQRA
jgi:protein-tyrosine-phosphatase